MEPFLAVNRPLLRTKIIVKHLGGLFLTVARLVQQQSWPSTGSIWQSYLFYEDWDLSNAQVKDGAICPRFPQETTKTSVWILARFYYRASIKLGFENAKKKSREIAIRQNIFGDGWPWKFFPTDVLVRDFWQDLLSVDAAIVLFLISTSCHIKIVLPKNKK